MGEREEERRKETIYKGKYKQLLQYALQSNKMYLTVGDGVSEMLMVSFVHSMKHLREKPATCEGHV